MASGGDQRERKKLWPWILALCLVLGSGVPIAYSIRAIRPAQPAPGATKPDTAGAPGVAALGRIEPRDGTLQVAAPYLLGRPSIVAALFVHEGDRVRRGQLLATLAGRPQLEVAVQQAEARIQVARRKVEQAESAPKNGDVSAQQAEIARLSAAFEHARADFARYEKLRQTDDVTVSDFEAKRAGMVAAQHALEAAGERLKSLGEVRQSEVNLAAAELEAAKVDAERARRDLDTSAVVAPVAGRVLQIHARPGETVGPSGLLDLGRTDRMYAVAEVYETDIARVRVGQRATVTGDLLATPLKGVVETIGMKVTRNSVLPGDPSSFAENRVIEVKVRLDEGEPVAALINGKVSVVFHP